MGGKLGDWAEDLENQAGDVSFDDKKGLKVVTRMERRDGKPFKVVHKFKLETKEQPAVVRRRRAWRKFGDGAEDGDGISTATTSLGDNMKMAYFTAADQQEGITGQEDDKASGTQGIKCRLCGGAHMTTRCPSKELLPTESTTMPAPTIGSSTAYRPPAARGEATTEASMSDRASYPTLKVSNLPEDATEDDLHDLVKSWRQSVKNIYLCRDKKTEESKGYAYIRFTIKSDAEEAKRALNKYQYGYMILACDWAPR